jgi:hypothetical protein
MSRKVLLLSATILAAAPSCLYAGVRGKPETASGTVVVAGLDVSRTEWSWIFGKVFMPLDGNSRPTSSDQVSAPECELSTLSSPSTCSIPVQSDASSEMMVSSNTWASFIAANYSTRRQNCRVTELDACKTSVITLCTRRVSLASNQLVAEHEWRLPGGKFNPRTSGIGRIRPAVHIGRNRATSADRG